jgi:hypothetical protein
LNGANDFNGNLSSAARAIHRGVQVGGLNDLAECALAE